MNDINNSNDIDSSNMNPYSSTIAIQFGSETSKTSTTISTTPKRNIKDHYEFKDILGTLVTFFLFPFLVQIIHDLFTWLFLHDY